MSQRSQEILDEAAEILGVDPSWLPKVLTILKRDHPKQLNAALSTAVSENARRANVIQLRTALTVASQQRKAR